MRLTTQSYIVVIKESSVIGGFFKSWNDDDILSIRLPQDIGLSAWKNFLQSLSNSNHSIDLNAKLQLLRPATLEIKTLVVTQASTKLTGIVVL